MYYRFYVEDASGNLVQKECAGAESKSPQFLDFPIKKIYNSYSDSRNMKDIRRAYMKISTKGRYALRLLLDLAVYNTGEPISLKDVAKRQEISEKYLEQIISLLNKAGFVRSIRGAQGGYMLAKAPSEYTVGMILRLTEGSLAPVSCVGEDSIECERRQGCVTVRVWEKLNDAVNQVVDNITLADLVEWHQEKADQYII